MYGGSGGFAFPGVLVGAQDSAKMRLVRKVYGLLLAALGVSVVTGGITYETADLLMLSLTNGRWLWLLALGLLFASAWVRTSYSGSMAILFAFAALEGFLVAPILFTYNRQFPMIGMQAALITLGVFSGLTCYVFTTKKDFSYLGGMLWGALLALIAVSFLAIFFPMSRNMGLVSSGFGALVFAGYILYDTSNVIHRYEENDAPQAALQLYVDVVNLFLMILRLLGGSRRS